jgi:hypothetical protein
MSKSTDRVLRAGTAGLCLLLLAALAGCQRADDDDACDPFATASRSATLAPIMATGSRSPVSAVPEEMPAPPSPQGEILRIPLERMARL